MTALKVLEDTVDVCNSYAHVVPHTPFEVPCRSNSEGLL
jgi:hypothetical protein